MTSFSDDLDNSREFHKSAGLGRAHASALAFMEAKIKRWPSEWGDTLQIIIFSDFDPPTSTLNYPKLGITLHPEKIEKSIVPHARTVLKATVTVKEKSMSGVLDASQRINALLGILTLQNGQKSG